MSAQDRWMINQCADCGYMEGELPQPCCVRCGSGTAPIGTEVVKANAGEWVAIRDGVVSSASRPLIPDGTYYLEPEPRVLARP